MASVPTSGLRLVELVPPGTLDRLRHLFEMLVGVPLVFTDANGSPVTPVLEPLRFCGSLVHGPGLETVCLRRRKWDVSEPEVEEQILAQHRSDRPITHRCMGGFEDCAVPIIVEGRAIGFAVFARSLPQPPDVATFREMAVAAGMAPEVGEAVAWHALVMPRERIAAVAEYLQVITNLVASAAHESLRARQVLELEKLRDDLTHMIVHDLRTPLTSIMGGLQTVVDAEYDSELTREFVPLALSSSETLLSMVNTLLDISKMESGEMKLQREEVSVAALVEGAVDQVRGLAQERGHYLTQHIPAECGTILADGDLLRRVLVNLLGNAIKFTPDGGSIELAARCEEGGLFLSVSDNGPGIPPEYRERIFEKFGQVESRKAGRKTSTGLGLTVCKMVAEAHGGRIWVDSEVGKGSTFTVFVPAEGRRT